MLFAVTTMKSYPSMNDNLEGKEAIENNMMFWE